MRKPKTNEDYPRAQLVGDEPGTGIETGGAARTEKKKRRLGNFAFRRNEQGSDPHEQARAKREREVRDLHSKALEKFNGQLWGLDYLESKNIYSYSKWIPRRTKDRMGRSEGFDDSYDELAESTLDRVLQQSELEDGSFALLDTSEVLNRINELEAGTPEQVGLTPEEASETMQRDRRYHEGVPVLLWKLGLMHFNSEEDIPYARGESFDEDATWKTDKRYHRETIISLPYDEENSLHKKIADMTGRNISSLEFTVYGEQSRGSTGLTMRTVNAVELQDAKAA